MNNRERRTFLTLVERYMFEQAFADSKHDDPPFQENRRQKMNDEEVFYFKIGLHDSGREDFKALSPEDQQDFLDRNHWFFTLRFKEEEDGKAALEMCEDRDWFEVKGVGLGGIRGDELIEELNTHMKALFKEYWEPDLHAIKWFKRKPG